MAFRPWSVRHSVRHSVRNNSCYRISSETTGWILTKLAQNEPFSSLVGIHVNSPYLGGRLPLFDTKNTLESWEFLKNLKISRFWRQSFLLCLL